MNNTADIAKQTLIHLSEKNINATPKEYTKEFCKIAADIKFNIDECEYFKKTLKKLSLDEKESYKKNIESVYDLIDILLHRVEKKNLQKMSDLIQKSMQPSISLNISDDLHSFSIKIGESPSLIFEESIQQEMERFIEERFEVDKKIVAKKTADIARLITLMSKYLNDAIDSSSKGTSKVSGIKDEIESISLKNSSQEQLNQLQLKLVNAAKNIEKEMTSVNKSLKSGKNEVEKLEQRIKELESELKETKEQSTKDHLTGALNRRTYENELKKFEEKFQRMDQDFAIVFFDIDHFKKINDTYGHDGGDIILKTFSALLIKLTRDIDIVGRYGGEEFIAAISYKNEDELEQYIKRIKRVVTTNKFLFKNEKIKITFSAGVELRSNNSSLEDTVTNADKSLYNAKNNGRNKIIFWNGKEF